MAGTHRGAGRSLFGSVAGTELTGVLEEVCLVLWRELNSPGCWKKFVWFCGGNWTHRGAGRSLFGSATGTHRGAGRSLFGSVAGTELTGVLEEVCLVLWRELNSPGCWKKFVWFCDGN